MHWHSNLYCGSLRMCVVAHNFIFEVISIKVFVERRPNASHKPFASALHIIQGIIFAAVFFLRSSLLLLMLMKSSKAQILIR